MVKGVNKRVIEVNNTGNKFFEKIVFFVTPEYSNLSAEELYNATEYLSLSLREQALLAPPKLRKRGKRRKRRIFGAACIGILITAGIILAIIF